MGAKSSPPPLLSFSSSKQFGLVRLRQSQKQHLHCRVAKPTLAAAATDTWLVDRYHGTSVGGFCCVVWS